MPVWLSAVIKSVFTLFILFLIAVMIFNILHINAPVYGLSMAPTLNNNYVGDEHDTVYINKYDTFKSGDIIVVHNPENDKGQDKYVIKRLIAEEGDKISISRTDNGGVSEKNGTYNIIIIRKNSNKAEVLKENYLPENTSLYYSYLEFQQLISKPNVKGANVIRINGIDYLDIHSGYVFYMGDNRSSTSASKDCLEYGCVEREKVVGKANIIVYKSTNAFSQIMNYYFKKLFG